MKKILLLLLLMSSSVLGGTYTVTSLPDDLGGSDHSADDVDTVYFIDTDSTTQGTLTAVGTGLSFSGSNLEWVVLAYSDTIIYGTDSTTSDIYGVQVLGNTQGLVINWNDGYVIEDYHNWDTIAPIDLTDYMFADNRSAMVFGRPVTGNSNIITIDGAYTESRAYGTRTIYVSGNSHSTLIKNTTVSNRGFAFNNRCQFEAGGIYHGGDVSDTADGATYNLRCENVDVLTTPHFGIYVIGDVTNGAILEVEDCSLNVDTWNELWQDSTDGTCNGRANGYGIQITHSAPGSIIKNNKITAGEQHHGGRGIQLVHAMGVDTNSIVICSNYVEIHEAPDYQFDAPYGYFPTAVKFRQGCRGFSMYDNTIIAIADGSIAWGDISGSYYPSACAFTLEHWSDEVPPMNAIIRNNLFRAIDISGGGSVYGASVVKWEYITEVDTTLKWEYNRIESDSIGYQLILYDSDSLLYPSFDGDTIKLVDSTSGHTAVGVGYTTLGYQVKGAEIIDPVYLDGNNNPAGDYDTNFLFGTTGSVSLDITLKRRIILTVKDTISLGIENVPCSIWSTTSAIGNRLEASGMTNTNGLFTSNPVPYWFESNDETDTTDYDDYRIKIGWDASDTTLSSIQLQGVNGSRDTTLVLTATEGTQVINSRKIQGVTIGGVR